MSELAGINISSFLSLYNYELAGRSEIEFSLTTPPPGRSEGPGPPPQKIKHVLFSAVTHPLHSRYMRRYIRYMRRRRKF